MYVNQIELVWKNQKFDFRYFYSSQQSEQHN